MSCYIVEKELIYYLAGVALGCRIQYHWDGFTRCIDTTKKAKWIAQAAFTENHESYDRRYRNRTPTEFDEVDESLIRPVTKADTSVAQIVKSIDCYEYQSCEHDEWEASQAKAFIVALRSRVMEGARTYTEDGKAYPIGYDEAEWGCCPKFKISEPEPEASLTLKQKRDSALSAFSYLKDYVSDVQLRVIRSNLYGEEAEYFCDLVAEITERVLLAPRSYEQDGKGEEAVAHFHYFVGGYDAYITELPYEIGEAHAYGYARFDHMPEGAGMGYISLEEIFEGKAEMDFHWEPNTIGVIRASYNNKQSA